MSQIIKNMDILQYHADKMTLSASSLKVLKKSTRAFIHYLTSEQERKSHFDFGNAFELYLVDQINGTSDFEANVAVKPTQAWVNAVTQAKPDVKTPKSTTAYKQLEAEWLEQNALKYVINDVGDVESMEALQSMAEGCLTDPVVRGMLKDSDYQESFFWTDPKTGVKMKTRPDLSKKKKKIIFDIKTCNDASPAGFAKQASNLNYPIQAICQIEGAINTGYFDECDGYFWLAVEKAPPYDWAIYEFQKTDIEDAYSHYNFLLRKGAEALKHVAQLAENPKHFVPSYGENADNKHGIIPLEIPLWYRYSF